MQAEPPPPQHPHEESSTAVLGGFIPGLGDGGSCRASALFQALQLFPINKEFIGLNKFSFK